ncbi:sterile alpha motif domain-containing protein 9-like [Lissotriton helveticus]
MTSMMNLNDALPANTDEWTKEHVRKWMTETLSMDEKYSEILYNEDVNGESLKLIDSTLLKRMGIPFGPAIQIAHKFKLLYSITSKTVSAAGGQKPGEDFPKVKEAEAKSSEKKQKKVEHCEIQADLFTKTTQDNIDTTGKIDKTVSAAGEQKPGEDFPKVKEAEAKSSKKKSKKTKHCEIQADSFTKTTQDYIDTTGKIDVTESNLCNVKYETSESKSLSSDQPLMPTCMPYPFDDFHSSKRYIEHHILSTPETGTLNFIDPVHEFKLFANTGNATEDELKIKFCNETFRFAAACLNSRTNGTIHFGVRDKPHGEIVGVAIENKGLIIDWFNQMFMHYFDVKNGDNQSQLEDAKKCIRAPRFVDVLKKNDITSNKFVIEVDVVPKYSTVQGKTFFTYQQIPKESKSESKRETQKSEEMCCFLREGASSKDIFANVLRKEAGYKSYIANRQSLDECRKKAEDEIRPSQKRKEEEGLKLVSMITGNRDTGNRDKLDNSYYKWYILVSNKCHPNLLLHLSFLKEIQWFAVFEFDPESEMNGVCKSYREERAANLYFPSQFQDVDDSTADKIEKLKLYQQTSWIFCNGRTDLDCEDYKPLEPMLWRKERAAEVKKLVSFFSRKDIMERGRFLVVFLLLSVVNDPMDPIVDIFRSFYEELNGANDILCICEGEQSGQRWKDLQSSYDISERCICNLSLEEINGTILKLKSVRKSSLRFLPSTGSSSSLLQRKDEDFMPTLEILCENECEDTEIEKNQKQFNAFKKTQEEHFYRGGNATWWNFYFSSKHHSVPFIKRDSYERLEELIMSWSRFEKQMCVKIITVFHHPGCGGTTLCMHLLWDLKKKFRCAILKNKTADFAEIGRQVTHLATYSFSKPSDYFPVLLLVDDMEEEENVYILQNSIQAAVADKYIRYEKPVVIILNCMRSQNPDSSSKNYSTNSVALINVLSQQEQRAFANKLKEIEMNHECPEHFYSFMIMKSNFDKQYIQKMVRNTLKGLNIESKEAQLISYLALLNSYVKDSTISLSQCEEYLGMNANKSFWGRESVEDKMGPYSCILLRIEVEEYGRYQGLRLIHPLIADQCLEELRSSYHLNKSTIMLQLLERECMFHKIGIGRDRFFQNLQSMLVTRQRKEHGDDADTLFSPLIEAIQEEEGTSEVENVLIKGTDLFHQNPFITQALARHLYIREKNFSKAIGYAKKAKKIAPDNSFLSDTLGQTYKAQLKHWMDENVKKKTITSEELKYLLDIAVSASDAFKESQEQTEKKGNIRDEWQKNKRKYEVYNTAGFLGQIEVCQYTISILELVPCFHKSDRLSKAHMIRYLSGSCDVPRDNNESGDTAYLDVLKEYHHYLNNLKLNLKKSFDFFDDYFVHFKPRNILRESAEIKIRKKVSDFFRKYTHMFLDPSLLGSRQVKQNSSTVLQTVQYRADLEASKADRFAGLLEYLNGHEKDKNKMEDIVNKYEFLLQQNTDKIILRDKQNFIIANIILNCINPRSNKVCKITMLKKHLRDVLGLVGNDHRYSEPYFLASLLFWPTKQQHELDGDSMLLEKYVYSMKNLFKKHYDHMCRSKQPIAHFYLGKGKELNRFIHKGKIDQSFSTMPARDLYSLWQTGEIWREKDVETRLLRLTGRTENDLVYVECGSNDKIKIPVRPVYLGQLRSGRSIERVSFYLGFSIEGLIAYDIQSI